MEISLEAILERSDELMKQMEELYVDKSKHVLPHQPDLKGIDNLYWYILSL